VIATGALKLAPTQFFGNLQVLVAVGTGKFEFIHSGVLVCVGFFRHSTVQALIDQCAIPCAKRIGKTLSNG